MWLRTLLLACIMVVVVSLRSFVLQPKLSSSWARFSTNDEISSIRDRTVLDSIKTFMITAAVACVTKMDTALAATEIVESKQPKPIITDMVYMDIKIANYTEESTGTNKGTLPVTFPLSTLSLFSLLSSSRPFLPPTFLNTHPVSSLPMHYLLSQAPQVLVGS